MTRFAQDEREALCDTFETVGPEAPTLCGGWKSADLAVHLVIRDGRPDLLIGEMLPIVGGWAKSGKRAIRERPWPDLVEAVRSGPPIYAPTRIGPVDELVNLVEFYIHHEDVLRGEPGLEHRAIPEAEQRALWSALTRMAKLMFRRAATGAELVSPYGRVVAKAPTRLGTVTIEGTPGELVLAAYGRHRVAEVSTRGRNEVVEALWASKLGLG